ncbi:MAG: hypothetical protein ABWY93_15345 [Mycobacterium sp.]
MKVRTRRIALGAVLIIAPILIGLGTAATSYADPSALDNGPLITEPVPHPAFPVETNIPSPGSSIHHHHQWNHG